MAEKTREQLLKEIEELKKEIAGMKSEKTDALDDDEKYVAECEKNMNEEVTIKLFKGAGEYADDLVIGLNGVTVKIQRGVYVTLPKKYVALIDLANIQEMEAADAVNAAQSDYENARNALE